VLTTFTWTNAWGSGFWEDGRNWNAGVGTAYPGFDGTTFTVNDVAQFTRMIKPANCTMQQAHSLASLQTNAYSAKLTLQGQLTLYSGGLIQGGTITQRTPTTNGPIEIGQGANFTVMYGDINPDGGVSNFTIDALAVVTFQNSQAGTFGDNLNNNGLVILNNPSNGPITLVNHPTITNNYGAEIRITTTDGSNLYAADADVTTIQNSGKIDKTAGVTSYRIDDPVINNSPSSVVEVDSGTLEFKKADANTGYSVMQSQGTILIKPGATLQPDQGLDQTAGQIIGLGMGRSTINGNMWVEGGTLQQGDGTAATIGYLDIAGNLYFTGGTLHTWVDSNNPTPTRSIFRVDGSDGVLVIASNTRIVVDKIGTGANLPPQDLMDALGGAGASIFALPQTVGGSAGYTQDFFASVLGGTNNQLWVK
jgi:hypothetical protein